ncbi:MAG: ABC transporter permease [Victivallaceae bacterium]|nr:ABC transporter permease [Victivallaceae bacterium]
MKLNRTLQLALDQVLVLVGKDFKLKYNSTAIGFLWSLLVPLFMSCLYYFVFGVVMRWDAHNYLLYLLCGNFFWQYFSNVVMVNGGVMQNNAGLLKKTSFKYELLLWGTFVAEGIHFLLTLIVLFLAMLCHGVTPLWGCGIVNFAVLLVFFPLFTLGISYFYAAANIYFRDLERIMNVFMTFWCFASPVFIPIKSVPAKYRYVYDLNPLAGFMGIFRDIFYEPGIHPSNWAFPCFVGVVVFLLGRRYFNRMSIRFAERM